ncbi:MAG: hypothetical protein R3A47_11540 [Polyangiales bacterium]
MVARREDEDVQKDKLSRGDVVLNGGLYFVMRKHFLSSSSFALATDQAEYETLQDQSFDTAFVRRDAKVFTPDLWGQLLWKDLRLEVEAAFVLGSIRNTQYGTFTDQNLKIRQFGFALESEYRALQKKLGIYFNTGLATGDEDVVGMSVRDDTVSQSTRANKLTNFSFHPNYRVDLILFRNILGHVSGAYYFKPGVSYDLIHNPFGQTLGARFDMIYSRASQKAQSYGLNSNLGLELNTALYYRSEDGPSFTDGFFIQFQYGILFPLAGLKYNDARSYDGFQPENFKVSKAQTLRLLMGVEF